ncbi:MAG: hypothetical protein E7665_11270 [Ruminococcaceae bacterium]|nr:hypothetical protein [Oscillospiraceae bacterium]
MKKTILLLLILLLILSLFSCTKPPETTAQTTESNEPAPITIPDFIEDCGLDREMIFEDYYFKGGSDLNYRKLNTSEGWTVFSNSVLFGKKVEYDYSNDGYDDRFVISCFLVDMEETEKNNGIPVLLIAYSVNSGSRTGQYYHSSGGIQYFNMDTYEIRDIITDVESRITNMCLYKDTIFFVTEEGTVNKINKDRTDHKSIDYKQYTEYINDFVSVNDGKIYCCNRKATGSGYTDVFRFNLDLTDFEQMAGKAMWLPYICGENLYYGKENSSGSITIEGKKYSNLNVYRRKLSDWYNADAEEKIVLENVCSVTFSEDKVFYYAIDEIANETDERNSLLHAYDLASSEDLGIIYENNEKDTKKYCSEFYGKYISGDYLMKHPTSGKYMHDGVTYFSVDLETRKEKVLEHTWKQLIK